MNYVPNERKSTFFVLLLLFEYILIPKFHLFGSIKICHIFSLIWVILYVLKSVYVGYDVRKVISMIYGIIFLGILGEATFILTTQMNGGSNFLEYLMLYINMICAIGIGYRYKNFNKKVFLYLLYACVILNIVVTIVGTNAPSFFSLFWASYREAGVRNHGLVGNSNSSMAIMNTILLCIAVYSSKGKLKITGIHYLLVFVLPIVCVFLINSRGEFICTIVLELYILLKQRGSERESTSKYRIRNIIIAVVALIVVYYLVFNILYSNVPRLQNSLDRLNTIRDIFDTKEVGKSESVLRPFYGFDVFFPRFLFSPVWGSGFDKGFVEPFIHKVGYHNDIYTAAISSGFIGVLLWAKIYKKSTNVCGLIVLIPFLITGLSNTYIYSNACITMVMIMTGCMMAYREDMQIIDGEPDGLY